jgi:hypothetical protein
VLWYTKGADRSMGRSQSDVIMSHCRACEVVEAAEFLFWYQNDVRDGWTCAVFLDGCYICTTENPCLASPSQHCSLTQDPMMCYQHGKLVPENPLIENGPFLHWKSGHGVKAAPT